MLVVYYFFLLRGFFRKISWNYFRALRLGSSTRNIRTANGLAELLKGTVGRNTKMVYYP